MSPLDEAERLHRRAEQMRGNLQHLEQQRNLKVREALDAGVSKLKVSKRLGISRTRVLQIARGG